MHSGTISHNKTFVFRDFEVEVDRRRLLKNGEQVALNAKTFDLLVVLLDRPGEIIEKDELMNAVWQGQFVEEGNLAVHISRLRKIFGEAKDANEFIATVPGRGYRFVAEVVPRTAETEVIISRTVTQIVVEEEIDDGKGSQTSEVSQAAPLQGSELASPNSIFLRPRVIASVALVFVIGVASYLLLASTLFDKRGFVFEQIELKTLTSDARAENAAISRDGKLIVYSTSAGEGESLWLKPTAGGEQIQIRPPGDVVYQSMAFSPEGDLIYYTAGGNFTDASLFRMSAFGGGPPIKIRDGVRRFSISPDGQRVVFVQNDAVGISALISTNIDGSDEKIVARLPMDSASGWISPAWSPDGRKIALAASVKPDEMALFIVDAKAGTVERLGDYSWQSVRALTWLKDGERLVSVGIAHKAPRAQIWQTSFPRGETLKVTSDLNDYVFATSVTDDNDLLAVAGISQSNVWVAPSDSLKDAKQITFSSTGARTGWVGVSWTPNGEILYTTDTSDGTAIWLMNADGSNQRQAVPTGGVNSLPTMDRNGKYIVFQSNRSGHSAIWRADADGEDLVKLTGEQIVYQPFVSADGKWVIFNTSETGMGRLFRVSTLGGQQTQLTDKDVGWAQVSNDSRYIAAAGRIEGEEKLLVFSIDGGEPLKVFAFPRLYNARGGIRWLPDDQGLVYRDWKNGLWRQNIEGGEPILIKDLPNEKLGNFSWSPDGKYFAFTRITTSRDVVLLSPSNRVDSY